MILAPQPGIEPASESKDNHWTTREVPIGISWLLLVPTCVLFYYHTAFSINGLPNSCSPGHLSLVEKSTQQSLTPLLCDHICAFLLQHLDFHP